MEGKNIMAQYPVLDNRGIIDGLNYALSGPSGLGQNFAGFSSSLNGDATGNYRPPFTQENFGTLPNIGIYVAPIALGTSEMLDERTWKFTFATPLTGVPFVNGQPITVTGVANSYYDGTYSPIGVIECTLTYVIARTQESYAVVAPSTGGTVELNSMDTLLSTDCNAKVTVTGSQDRVILSSQLNNTIYLDPARLPGSYYYTVQLNRYISFPTNDPVNPEYRFDFDKTIASKEYLVSTPTSGITNEFETFFINILDEPKPGYYWYILEVTYTSNSGDQIVTNSVLGLRSFSAQVLKP
jgi:hypothetical protein